MNILDTNSIHYICENKIVLKEEYLISPDVKDESEMIELIFNMRLSSKILEISSNLIFDEIIYFRRYKEMLNRHGGRSFYNMTGFGDISILATLKMLEDVYNKTQARLPGMEENITVYTNDQGLRNKITAEFPTGNAYLNIHIVDNNTLV